MRSPTADTSLPPLHQDFLLAVLDGTSANYRTSAKDAIWREAQMSGFVITPGFTGQGCKCPICNPTPPPTDEELGTRGKWTARRRQGARLYLDLVRLPQSIRDATRDPGHKQRTAYLIDHCRSCNSVIWIPIATKDGKEVAV